MTVANGKEISCAQTFAIKSQRTVKINTDAALDALSQAEPQQSGGSFTYPDEQDDAALRNRFLLWRTNGATLNIEEHSLERELKENSITVQFSGSRIIPGCGCFTSRGLLVFIVPTVCSVHRFIMNHPFTLEKRAPGMSVLSSFPEGDKLAMFHDQAALTASSAPVRAAVALGADGRSVVALCLADGSVQLVTLSAYGDKNAPGATQTTLRHDGAMKRLLRLSNETDAAVDLVLQREHKVDDTFVYVVHRDGKLRIWSSTSLDLKCTTSLLNMIAPTSQRAEQSPKVESIAIRKCVLHDTLFLIVHMLLDGKSKFLILSPVASRTQVVKVMEIKGPKLELVDFDLTASSTTSLWAVWRDAENRSVYKRKIVNVEAVGQEPWLDIEPDTERDYPFAKTGKSSVFDPDRYSFDTVHRALMINCKSFPTNIAHGDWASLARQVDAFIGSTEFEKQFMTASDRSGMSLDGGGRSLALREEQFWNSLQRSCDQYHQMSCQPLCLLSSPIIEMNGIIQVGRFTLFLSPDVQLSTLCTGSADSANQVARVGECLLRMDTLVGRLELTEEDDLFAQMKAIVASTADKSGASESVQRLSALLAHCEQFLPIFVEQFIRKADPQYGALNLTDTFTPSMGSALASGLLAASLLRSIKHRLQCCDRLLALLAFACHIKHVGILPDQWSRIFSELIPQLVGLRAQYMSLAKLLAMGMFEPANVPLGYRTNAASLMTSVAFALYESSTGAVLKRTTQLALEQEAQPVLFGLFAPFSVAISLFALWPTNDSLLLPEFFATHDQHAALLTYCELMRPWPDRLQYALRYYQAVALARLNMADQALDAFLKVLDGLAQVDPVLIKTVFPHADLTFMDHIVTDYFLKIIDILEKQNLTEQVLSAGREALKRAAPNDPNVPTLLMLLFKHEMDEGRFSEALVNIQSNPSAESRRTCLRDLLHKLVDAGRIDVLVGLEYGRVQSEVVGILESRARAFDLLRDRDYYEVLFAFYSFRSNFRRAASCMYELATRLRQECSGEMALRRRARALAVCEQCLRLVDNDYAWIALPRAVSNAEDGRNPKRDADDRAINPEIRPLKTVTCDDVYKEYVIADARLQLVQRNGAAPPPMEPLDIVTALLDADLYDQALLVNRALELPVYDLLDKLTTKCLQMDALRESSVRWLDDNKMLIAQSTVNGSLPAEQSWQLLRACVDRLTDVDGGNSRILRTAAETILKYQRPVPAWLAERYLKADFPDYLRLLIDYGKLEEAQSILIDHLDVVLSQVTSPNARVCLPYSSIDQLMLLSADSHSDLLRTGEVEAKMKTYLDRLDAFSAAANFHRVPAR